MPRTWHDARPSASRFWIVTLLLVVAITFGGGGSPAPIPELVVELTAIAALLCWFLMPVTRPGAVERPIWIGAALFLAIPVIQLIPLPPALWHALPGREHQAAALSLIDGGNTWHPLSIAPALTFASLLSLLPPLAMLYMVSSLEIRDRQRLLLVVVALAFLAGLVGLVQLAGGDANVLRFYDATNLGFATGFQANRNAACDIPLIAIIALSARRDLMRDGVTRIFAAALMAFFVLSVVLTGSRTGMVLILVAAGWGLWLYRPSLRASRRALLASAAAILVIGVLGVFLSASPQIRQSLDRFEIRREFRPELWADTLFATRQFWPIGSGMGTFVPAFVASERLEVVDNSHPNRAHNDFLEFALETGLVGLALLVAGATALVLRLNRIMRREETMVMRACALVGAGALAVLGLHSLVDYPMRSMSLATLAALSIGLVSRSGSSGDQADRNAIAGARTKG